MPRSYVNNASNRSLGRVGMPVGSMPVSSGRSSGSSFSAGFGGSSSKTYVDNAYNRSVGRVGMEHGTAVMSRASSSSASHSSSPKTYVDNAYNRSVGRVGMEHGTAVMSRSSSSSSASQSSSPKTYVDNAYNRSVGRVGMEHGTAVMSRSSSSSASQSSSPKTYVDNAYNRSVGRVGMEHGTAVMSRPSSSSSSQSSSPKTYVDNAYNRRVGRVGMKHGTAVVSKASSQSPTSRVYVDNAFNRRLGRVGMPLGSMIVSRSSGRSRSKTGPPANRRQSSMTRQIRDLTDRYFDQPEEDVNPDYLWEDSMYAEEASEQAVDLIRRMEQVRLWQQESGKRKEPLTSADLLESYRGNRIDFEELELKEKIGHGGFGDIYCAKWKGTVVAVKKLRVQRVSKKRLQEFTSEVQVFCTLDHPNIVTFIGACCVTPNIAIVMEFMEGCLFQILHMSTTEDTTLTEENKLDIIIQISRGLAYLHKNNIAHCDIKSQNVLIAFRENSYVAKITDFGLSMMRNSSDTSSTMHDQVRNIGTPRYSAPEVLRGELLDRAAMMRADVYSLGLLVFEIISEDEPFDSLNAKQIERYVGNGEEKPVFDSDVDDTVKENVMVCWNRDPYIRPSAKSFCDSVEQWESLYK